MFCPATHKGSIRTIADISNIFLFIFLFFRYTLPVAPANGAEHGSIISIILVYRLPPDELLPPEEEEDEDEEEDPDEDEPELRLPPDEYEPPEL